MWRLEYAVTLLPYTKIAPMMQCAMGAIYTVMHVYCTYFYYSHSKVDLYLEIASRVLVVFSIVAIPQYCITHALVMTSKMHHFSIGRSVFLRSEAMSLIRDSITSRISFLYESVISSELAWINGLRCLSFSASRRTFFELSIEE